VGPRELEARARRARLARPALKIDRPRGIRPHRRAGLEQRGEVTAAERVSTLARRLEELACVAGVLRHPAPALGGHPEGGARGREPGVAAGAVELRGARLSSPTGRLEGLAVAQATVRISKRAGLREELGGALGVEARASPGQMREPERGAPGALAGLAGVTEELHPAPQVPRDAAAVAKQALSSPPSQPRV
jgi:hypothetical protein